MLCLFAVLCSNSRNAIFGKIGLYDKFSALLVPSPPTSTSVISIARQNYYIRIYVPRIIGSNRSSHYYLGHYNSVPKIDCSERFEYRSA